MELAEKKCIPCSGETPKLNAEQIDEFAEQIPDWGVYDTLIVRSFEFNDFKEAMAFTNRVADIAENENHHPDLHISSRIPSCD